MLSAGAAGFFFATTSMRNFAHENNPFRAGLPRIRLCFHAPPPSSFPETSTYTCVPCLTLFNTPRLSSFGGNKMRGEQRRTNMLWFVALLRPDSLFRARAIRIPRLCSFFQILPSDRRVQTLQRGARCVPADPRTVHDASYLRCRLHTPVDLISVSSAGIVSAFVAPQSFAEASPRITISKK